jgi:hypothetical protein
MILTSAISPTKAADDGCLGAKTGLRAVSESGNPSGIIRNYTQYFTKLVT